MQYIGCIVEWWHGTLVMQRFREKLRCEIIPPLSFLASRNSKKGARKWKKEVAMHVRIARRMNGVFTPEESLGTRTREGLETLKS